VWQAKWAALDSPKIKLLNKLTDVQFEIWTNVGYEWMIDNGTIVRL